MTAVDWATDADVAAWLGAPSDALMVTSTDVANAWAYRTRPDLRVAQLLDDVDNPGVWLPPADVKHATVLYAAITWRERTSPQGYATYSEYGADGSMDAATAMTNVYRLIGSRKPAVG